MYSVESLKSDLQCLGVQKDDCILVRAGLRSIDTAPHSGQRLVDAILDLIGPNGTLVGLAHSGVYRRDSEPKHITDRWSPAITGGFANILLSREEAVRSTHPTHSIVAIGKYAQQICADHNSTTPCFSFVQDLLNLNAKMALIGCAWSGPGFSTTDFELLVRGFAHRTLSFRRQRGSWYRDRDGKVTWFQRDDDPGCSRGYSNLYSSYLKAEILHSGFVGSAFSLLVPAREAHNVDRDEIETNPRVVLCSDPLCFSCRFSRSFNRAERPVFMIRAFRHLGRTRILRGEKR